MSQAPGGPGLEPTWTSSAKDLVTTAIGGVSRTWLALGHGIGNEVYWPSNGEPQIRDIGFIVVAGGTWTELKRADRYDLATPAAGILAPSTTHRGDGWAVALDWALDDRRDVVLVRYTVTGTVDGLYVLVAPHLGNDDSPNTAWIDGHLYATADDTEAALCVAVTPEPRATSVGFVGTSDGWQDITRHLELSWSHDRADHGNVALTAQLDPSSGVIAIGLADNPTGAATLARSSLADGFPNVHGRFVGGWEDFMAEVDTSDIDPRWVEPVRLAASVLACHEDRNYPGATIASLSIPWGNDRRDLGGYHLVWARDCVESAFARIAIGDRAGARRTLEWLAATQRPDGHWTQNAYPNGRAFWTGIQLDEVALPVLLARALGTPATDDPTRAMVRSAIRFLVDNGPASPQDRWEENAGTNAFTLATVIAALIAAEPWLTPTEAAYATALADYWNERIEDWLYVADGPLCAGRQIAGYYVRLGSDTDQSSTCGRVDIRNRPDGSVDPHQLVALDFLALVRFGLRQPDDPRIVDTVRLVDDLLAAHLPTGIAYYRYNGDGYGEHDDGRSFDGTGRGRPWPLLAGERGHYTAQFGDDPMRFLASMAAMTGPGGLLPEQVWDADPIPERFLRTGYPTGSAMPLVWAHAEFAKLATYSRRGRPIEQLDPVVEHCRLDMTPPWHWRPDAAFTTVPCGRSVVFDLDRPFEVIVGDGPAVPSEPAAFDRHTVAIPPAADPVAFTCSFANDRRSGELRWAP